MPLLPMTAASSCLLERSLQASDLRRAEGLGSDTAWRRDAEARPPRPAGVLGAQPGSSKVNSHGPFPHPQRAPNTPVFGLTKQIELGSGKARTGRENSSEMDDSRAAWSPHSATYWQCGLQQATGSLVASVSLSVKWVQQHCHPGLKACVSWVR